MNLADLQTMGYAVYALQHLFACPSNVRSNDKRTPEAVMSMALSIHAHGGLLQNLVVVPEIKGGKRTGRAAVSAGETRRQALCLLAAGGVPDAEGFDLDFPVPVREVASEEATASSATENVLRTQMHPADQFKAFAELFEQCGSVEQVASMFGVTTLVVQRRLKLAGASPRLFELYRSDGMTLEQLMALCLTDDQTLQEKVWNAARQDWQRQPQELRRALTTEEVSATKPIARFVTVKAYEQAGGVVRRDLFSNDDEGWLTDATLLRELASAKLDKLAQGVRKEGWSWLEVRVESTQVHQLNVTQAAKGLRAMSEEERTGLRALEAELDEAQAERDALWDKDQTTDEEDRRCDELRRLIGEKQRAVNTMREALAAWTPEVLAHAGAVVTFGHDGKTVILRGLVRPEDRKAVVRAAARDEAIARGEDAADAAAKAQAKTPDNRGGLSEGLNRRLTAHRTVALQRVLADNTHVALAALAHSLIQRVLDGRTGSRTLSALDLQAKGCEAQLDAATESSCKASRAWTELQALRDQWGERMPGDQDKLLPWLIRLPMTELCDLLALCTALTVNAVQPANVRHEADALAAAVDLDMADWWEPTADEYLDKVPKQLIAQALSEASMSAAAVSVEKMKKGEAVARAADLLCGKRWLPAVLRARG